MGQAAKNTIKRAQRTIKTAQHTAKTAPRTAKIRHQYGGSYSNGGSENGTGCYKDRESDRPGRPRHGKVRRRCRENHRKGRFCCGKGPACVCQGAGGRYRRWRLGCYLAIVMICLIGLIVASPFGLFFSGEDAAAPDHTHRCPGDNQEYEGKLGEMRAASHMTD